MTENKYIKIKDSTVEINYLRKQLVFELDHVKSISIYKSPKKNYYIVFFILLLFMVSLFAFPELSEIVVITALPVFIIVMLVVYYSPNNYFLLIRTESNQRHDIKIRSKDKTFLMKEITLFINHKFKYKNTKG